MEKVIIEITKDGFTMSYIDANDNKHSQEWERTETGSQCKTKVGESELEKNCHSELYKAITSPFTYNEIMNALRYL